MRLIKIKGLLLVLIGILIFSCSSKKDKKMITKIEINRNWKFRQSGIEKWYDATVPGCIHTDLLKNKLIGKPFFRTNEKKLQWIENEDWEYKTIFNVDKAFLNHSNIELVFKGLDTYAKIYLNDSLILNTDNMFREWNLDCKNLIKEGENSLRICFLSAVKENKRKSKKISYRLPDIRAFTRKAPYQFGWDWGPRFVTSGIWRPVYLQAWNNAKIKDIQIIQNKISKDNADISAIFEIQSNKKQKAFVSVTNKRNSKIFVNKEVELIKSVNNIKLDFNIEHPKLWWTNGLGEPYLYDLKVMLKIGKTFDEKSIKIGIRTIEIVQEKDSVGKSFYLKLNGVPVFMKGANYIPQDNFLNRVKNKRYEKLIKNAAEANMNMLRVWGGGIYENDIFYDLCDENGILIWQDFMFACTMYPGDKAFLENVKQEAIQNVKRLKNHPCLALWCGNNEIASAWQDWGWQKAMNYSKEDSTEIWNNYLKIFDDILPKIVNEYDPKSFYWQSSPSIGWGHIESNYEGDSHYWGVWWGKEPFEMYKKKVARFMSEYGFQSFPEFKTIKTFSIPEDWNVNSEVMLSHQKHPIGNQLIKQYLQRYYQMPKNFKSFLYLSQLLQAEGVKIAIEAHRRAKPYCMGTLYWQLNDCWPVTSWSSIDYYGRWKALHYFVKKDYNDILVSPNLDNGVLYVYIISDKLVPVKANLILNLIDFDGNVLWNKEIKVNVQSNSSNLYFQTNLKKFLKNFDRKKIAFQTKVLINKKTLSKNILYFLYPKNLSLPIPHIYKQIYENKNGYVIKFKTDKLAKNVYLSVNNVTGFFSDNYFDLFPNETIVINFITKNKVKNFEAKLKIISLADTF